MLAAARCLTVTRHKASFKTPILQELLSHGHGTLIECQKSLSFSASQPLSGFGDGEQTDRKEQIMGSEGLVGKDFIERITLELKLAR